MKLRQEIIELYDDYTHEHLDRRSFVERLLGLAGSASAAAVMLGALEASEAAAAIIAPDDARLSTRRAGFDGPHGRIDGYLARPADRGTDLPAVLVIHENRGLNAHIEDVARRAALAGYLAFAPDFLSGAGGTPADSNQARQMIRALDRQQTVANAVAAAAFLDAHPNANGKVGVVGFCWGGWLTNQVAVHSPAVDAAAPFYGRQPSAADAARIRAPLLLHYAGLDARINAGIDAFRTALEAAGAEFTLHIYQGVNHAFHNDTAAARYDKPAAGLAWSRTMAFFGKHLGS